MGPNNRVEPGAPDQGQPTHFEIGRVWGVFVVKVPKDFGTKAVTWTIVSNGETQSIPLTLNKGYPISPYKELGMGNQPPVLAFSEGGAKVTGPADGRLRQLHRHGEPADRDQRLGGGSQSAGARRGPADAGPPFCPVATVSFHKFRGPGKVTFDKAAHSGPQAGRDDHAAATFAAPGDYLLRVQANDESGEGGGGFQCCWTNTYVKVTVR